jgi:integrase/recombinase XerD
MDKKADMPIAAITPHDCQKFYDDLIEQDLAPATLRCEMKTVASVFNYARRLGLIATNPVTAVELPERIKQVQRMTFTPAQVQMLINAADMEWRTCILLGYYAGLRMSDAVTLEWSSVDLAGNKLVVETHKTGETLEIPMHPTLEAHLSKLAGDTGGPVCPSLAAARVSGRSGLSRKFIALMRSAGINSETVDTAGKRTLARLSFHALRTSFNSALFNKGVDQELRRKLTGHKSDAMNDKYTRTEMQTLRDAVNKLPALKA